MFEPQYHKGERVEVIADDKRYKGVVIDYRPHQLEEGRFVYLVEYQLEIRGGRGNAVIFKDMRQEWFLANEIVGESLGSKIERAISLSLKTLKAELDDIEDVDKDELKEIYNQIEMAMLKASQSPTEDDIMEELAERNPEALLAHGFNKALVGIVEHMGKALALYDIDKCVEILIDNHDMTPTEAMEYMSFNVLNCYMGENTPLFANIRF